MKELGPAIDPKRPPSLPSLQLPKRRSFTTYGFKRNMTVLHRGQPLMSTVFAFLHLYHFGVPSKNIWIPGDAQPSTVARSEMLNMEVRPHERHRNLPRGFREAGGIEQEKVTLSYICRYFAETW